MRRPLPDRLRPVVSLAVAPVILVFLVSSGMGLLGYGLYFVVFFCVILWNFFAVWRVLANRWGSWKGLLSPFNLSILAAYAFVFLVWGPYTLQLWNVDRTVFALAYAVATALVATALWLQPRTRRLRNHLILVYNLIGTLALAAWAAADSGGDGGDLLAATAQGWGIMQALLFSWGAFFAPIFFLPPLLVYEPRVDTDEEGEGEGEMLVDPRTGIVTVTSEPPAVHTGEGLFVTGAGVGAGVGVGVDVGEDAGGAESPRRRRRPLRSVASLGFDAALGGMVVLLVFFCAIGAINVASWGTLPHPDEAEYGRVEGFEFAAMGRAFTDRRYAVDDWEEVVQQEIDAALGLGLDLVRYDLHKEFIDDPEQMAKLDMAVERIRAAGLDVMLSPFGSVRWESDHPSFDDLVEELTRETLLLVERYEPAWVLPFFEPNGQVWVNLGRMAPVEDWIPVIDSVGREVRALSNVTLVLIEVAMEPEQGIELVEALSEPGLAIDAIGVDLYPLSAEMLDTLEDYREHATNDMIGFWVSEFGVESVMSGQGGQARALSSVVSRATLDLNATGVCVWALLDDTVVPSNLGLVARDGTPKEAYDVLRDAIAEVRGD